LSRGGVWNPRSFLVPRNKLMASGGRALTCLGIDIGIRNFSFCVYRESVHLGAPFHVIGAPRGAPRLGAPRLGAPIGTPIVRREVLQWGLVDLLGLCGYDPSTSCKQVTATELYDIVEHAMTVLFPRTFFLTHEINHVAIEQQPCGKFGNSKMVMLSMFLFGAMRRELGTLPPLRTVKIVSARTKYQDSLLRGFDLSRERVYADRKALSVTLTNCLLQRDDIHVSPRDLFENTIKKDDLADSFLLAYAYLQLWNTHQ
jgi:hypothetical protein